MTRTIQNEKSDVDNKNALLGRAERELDIAQSALTGCHPMGIHSTDFSFLQPTLIRLHAKGVNQPLRHSGPVNSCNGYLNSSLNLQANRPFGNTGMYARSFVI